MSKEIKIIPYQSVGPHKLETLKCDYKTLVDKIGFDPNTTEMDDPDKVHASWGIQTEDGKRKAYIWSYKHYGPIEKCIYWSVHDTTNLLLDIGLEKSK